MFKSACTILFAALLVAGCAASDQGLRPDSPDRGTAAAGGADVRILAGGTQGELVNGEPAVREAPFVRVAKSEAEFRALWQQYVGPSEAPSVDFGQSAAVFLLVPSRPTGGYSIDYQTTELRDSTLVVNADLDEPGGSEMVTQALTAPYLVLVVGDRRFDHVEWMNRGRLLAQSRP